MSGGTSSVEAQAATALGYKVEVATNAQWAAKTQADFAGYRALILGDAACGGSITAAVANKSVWGPVINGNVFIVGSDPVFHNSQGGGALTNNGIAFAVDASGRTGMYITLSCYYHDTATNTPVPLLDVFSPGGFTVRGVGCYNDAHIVASHPALTGLTDATLSNWSCSVHEAFDKWPVDFTVLAIARGIGAYYTATDGSTGTPYILARGAGLTVISDIKLTPLSATVSVGLTHQLTATVTTNTPTDGTPVVGTTVTFGVIGGPNTGRTATAVTDSAGVARFSYSSSVAGTDYVKATFVDSAGRTQSSDTVAVIWENLPPTFSSDQKAGSVLVFPYYSSDVNGNFSKADTLLTITNVLDGDATGAGGAPNYQYLHLFFVGSNCSPADTFACLTPGESLQFKASEYDPLTTGYLIAVAVNAEGVPIQNNSFIGSAFVRDDTKGVIDSYGAQAFAKLLDDRVGPAPIIGGAAVLQFDGVSYEGAPIQFSAQIQDLTKSDQTLILASVSGDLGTKLNATAQSGTGAIYKDDERVASFSTALGESCFIVRAVSATNFRVVPGPLTTFLKDRYGYLRFNLTGPAVGLMFTRQGAAGSAQNRWAGIRTLHAMATVSAELRLPIFPPACQ